MERVYEVRLAEGATRAGGAGGVLGRLFAAAALGRARVAPKRLGSAARSVWSRASRGNVPERGYPAACRPAFGHQMAGRFGGLPRRVAAEAAGDKGESGGRDRPLGIWPHHPGTGRLVGLGQIDRGMALLDESMLAATANRLSPVFTGLIYCIVISSCQRVLRHRPAAREWTAALLGPWCESEAEGGGLSRGPVWFTAQSSCRIGGAWPEALDEARHGRKAGSAPSRDRTALLRCALSRGGDPPFCGGASEEAETLFHQGRRACHGHEPQTGAGSSAPWPVDSGRPRRARIRRIRRRDARPA